MQDLLRFAILSTLVALASMALVPAAHAQAWQASVRPDSKNGGSRIVLVGDLGNGAALFAQCDGQRTPTLAFISNNLPAFPALPTDRDVQLSFDIDGFKTTGSGQYYEHGEGYLGLKITDRASVARLIGEIAAAKFGIALTITNRAYAKKEKYAAGLSGANDGARQFADYCFKGNELAAPRQQSAGEVAAPRESGWRVYQAASGGALVLAGMTEPKEGTLYVACTGGTLTLLYLSDRPRELPFDRNARSVVFALDIDGFSFGGEAGYYEDERGAGIAYGERGTIFDMLSVLSLAQSQIRLTLTAVQGAPYVRDLVVFGAAEAGRAFLDNCR